MELKYYFKHAQLSKLSLLSMLIFKYDAETGPWSLDLFVHVPFQLPGEHTALQPCGAVTCHTTIAISFPPGTLLLRLNEVKHHLMVKCLAQGLNIDTTMAQR